MGKWVHGKGSMGGHGKRCPNASTELRNPDRAAGVKPESSSGALGSALKLKVKELNAAAGREDWRERPTH